VKIPIARIVLSLPFLIVAGVFGLYLVSGFFLVNPLAQKILPWVGEQKLASQLSADEVRFNPLTLEVSVRGLKLAEPDGAPLASFERLYVNVDSTGIFRWAWRIQELRLDKPAAKFVVRPGGRLNWQGLLDKLGEDEKPPSDTLVRVLIDRIKISGGDIDYSDMDRPGKPFQVSLEPLGIELDGLSTLPEDRGDYLIAARLPEQGGTLWWKGDIGLNPVASRGMLGLEGVQIDRLLRALKTPRGFDIPDGTLAAGLNYQFALVPGQDGQDVPSLTVADANLLVRQLVVTPSDGGEPVLQLREARIDDASFDLARRSLGISRISLADGSLAATREADGRLDWQRLFAGEPGAAATGQQAASPAGPASDWAVAVREIHLTGWSARYTDRSFAAPLALSVENFGFDAALAGKVGAVTELTVGPVNAALGPVRVASGGRDVASLARASLANAGVKLAERRIEIEAVELSGMRTEVQLDKNKALNWAGYLEKSPHAPAAETAPVRPDGAGAKPFALALDRFVLDGVEIGFVDASTPQPVRLDLTQGRVALRDLSLDLDRPLPVEAGFALKQGGRLAASGSVSPGKSQGRLEVRLSGLSLQPFAPYVNQFARLDLQSGTASARGTLAVAPGDGGTRADFDGGFAVDDLALTEEGTGEAFLGWKRLSSDSLDFALAPGHLRMTELVAEAPFGKLIIFEDGSINLKRILRSSAPTENGSAAPPATQPASAPAAPAFPLTIERVRIVDANVQFADLSLTPRFGTRMHGLSSVVTGLSTDARSSAQVELDGRVDEFGSARVRGTVQPFRATEFTDLTLAFRDLEMAILTPYSGKFAGRRIDSGTLSVDLEYKIKQRQLAGENKFIVNKLKLGERVDSPDAMNLPLDLAIALLQDSNGLIDLDLPVSGSLDDPQFSYGHIVWKAIVNVLTKLVTAPFRALGKLLGGDAEKFESVVFDPGSSALLPPEQGKLKTLAEALGKRPSLALTITPGFDPEADTLALQVLAIRQEAAKVAGVRLAPGETPGPVDVNLHKIQTWLEDRYLATAGRDDYRKLRASFQDKSACAAARALENETVERLARRFKTRQEGPPSAFHAELLERVTRQVSLPPDALVKLGQARGQAARDELLKLGLAADRIALAAPDKQPLKDRFVGSTMTLSAGKAAP